VPRVDLHERLAGPRPLVAYGAALGAVLAATAIREALQPLLGTATPYAVHFLAIMFAAAYGGLRPGLVAVALSAVLGFRLFVPQPARTDLAGVLLFGATGCALAWMSSAFRSARLATHLSAEQERSAAREARTAAERLRVTLASIGDAVIVTAADGSISFMNPLAESLTGWSLAEAAGKMLADVFHIVNEISRASVESPVARVMREGTVVGLANHTILISRQGVEIPIDDSGAPIRDTDGSIAGIVMVFRDVTERRRSEAALRESEEKYRVIAETATDAIITIDEQSEILFVNPAIATIFGYTPEELLGKELTILMPDYLRHVHRESLKKYVETGVKHLGWQAVELQGLHRSGREIPLELSFGESRVASKHTFTGIIRDISERKRAQEHRLQLAAIVESSNDAIIGKKLDGIVTSWNPGAQRMYGYTPEEVLGRPISILVPADRPDELPEILERLRAGERIDHYETRRVRKDGATIDVSVTISPIRSDTGQIIGASAVARDITERKLAEEERDALLEREKLAHAEAENANRVKDEFLATLSHELRTPLQAVLGFSKLLRAGRLDASATAQAIETIERNAQAQTFLIEDLLDQSRIITGKLAIHARPHDLAPLAEAALDSVRPAANAKGVMVSLSVDPQLGLVPIDANRIEQAMRNLLSNAVKFTPRGGKVSLQVSRVGSSLQIVVSDTGIGVPPEFQPYVFDPFRQAQSSSTRSHGGLGLGLSIVRQIVEMHGGTVEVESEGTGRGTIFRISLPIGSLQIASSRAAPYQSSQGPSELVLDRLSVLVVDDHRDSRELISVSLQRYGAAVTTADSARAALEVLQESSVDVIVSDIGMPGEDGLSLIRKVRALGETPAARIPAIALSGYAMDTDRLKAEAAGFQLHVAKPIDPETLVLAVAKLTGRV
jgi:PAS domain S-box-containing protein